MRPTNRPPAGQHHASFSAEGGDRLFQFLSPAMLYGRGGEWESLRGCTVPVRWTLTRVVLPFALIPPLMILLAGHNHPETFGASPGAVPWEWIASVVFLAEIASVYLIGRIIHGAAPEGDARPSRDQAYLLAALAAVPLWASAVVLALPSIVALVTVHLLGQVASVRVLYRGLRSAFLRDSEVEALHLVYMAHSAALVFWVLLLALFLGSLASG